jgi:hypothetical protein
MNLLRKRESRWQVLVRCTGESTRDKVNDLLRKYWDDESHETDPLKDELRRLGPNKSGDQLYFLERLDREPIRDPQWSKGITSKYAGIGYDGRRSDEDDVALY